MRFLPPDEHVNLYEDGFGDDILGRTTVSKSLFEVLERIEDPLVVALDGRWGTGKSYFLKRWVGAHRLQNDGKALTLYFDAFAHDYLSDPLVALVGALLERTPVVDEPKLHRIKKAAIKFIKPAARIGLAIATYGATEALGAIGDVGVEAARDEAELAIEEFWKREEGRQSAMAEFRSSIIALTHPAGQEEATPLVIVIDELDRCRPDYALEVLEVIKHFFSVPFVHFVLGVNLKALENSVKTRYGADTDATAYLHKFISFSISLPNHIGDHERTPSVLRYATHLGQSMETPDHLFTEIKAQLGVLSRQNNISMRDVGKIMSAVALLPSSAMDANLLPGLRQLVVTLVITRVIRPDLLERLVDTSLTSAELISYMGATDQFIHRKLVDGQWNSDYSHDTATLFSTWNYIKHDGGVEDGVDLPKVATLLDGFGQPRNVKKIPRRIFEDWVTIFRAA